MDKLFEFSAECKKWENNYYLDFDSMKGSVYHYTGAFALENILKGKKLWVTKSDFLNDETEYRYGIELAKKVFKEKNYKYISSTMIQEIEKQINSNLNRSFIFSTSRNKDSVNLWGNYSNNDGYCIGFNLNEMEERIFNSKIYVTGNKMNNKVYEKYYIPIRGQLESVALYSLQVIYDIKQQKEIILEIFSHMEKVTETFNLYKDDIEDRKFLQLKSIYSDAIDTAFTTLTKQIRLFKNPIFKQDDEYRIVFEINKKLDVIKYRQLNGIFIPYIEVGFDEDNFKGLPIESITIGPKNNLDIAERGLKLFVESLNYKTAKRKESIFNGKILLKKSDAPLRY
jgi:hypothetical protein